MGGIIHMHAFRFGLLYNMFYDSEVKDWQLLFPTRLNGPIAYIIIF